VAPELLGVKLPLWLPNAVGIDTVANRSRTNVLIVTQRTVFIELLLGFVFLQMLRMAVLGAKAPVLRQILGSLFMGIPPLFESPRFRVPLLLSPV
jgi:hypothetical protein